MKNINDSNLISRVNEAKHQLSMLRVEIQLLKIEDIYVENTTINHMHNIVDTVASLQVIEEICNKLKRFYLELALKLTEHHSSQVDTYDDPSIEDNLEQS